MATGSLTNYRQHDWLSVQLVGGQAYEITLNSSYYSQLEVGTATVLDEGIVAVGGQVVPVTDSPATTPAFFRPYTTGTYYVDVSNPYLTGSYTVTAAPVSTDYTNNTATTGAVAVGGSTTGMLTNAGQHDWVAVQLTAGQAYEFTLSSPTQSFGFEVGSAAVLGEGLLAIGTVPPTTSKGGSSAIFFRPDKTATYYLDVNGSGTGGYTVAAAAVATDYTNDATTAGRLAIGGSASGTLAYAGQDDWFAIQLTAGQAYEFGLSSPGTTETLRIGSASVLDEGLLATGASTGGNPYSTPPTYAFFRPDVSGTYYVDVGSVQGSTGGYTVTAAAVTTDYTDNAATTGALAVGGTATGTLANPGQDDWLAIHLTVGQAYVFTLSGSSASFMVGTGALLDKGILALGGNRGDGTNSGSQSAFFRPDGSGTYYIDVSNRVATGSYTVSATAVATDYTNNASTSGVVTIGRSSSGMLTYAGQHDWLAVQLSAGQAYTFTLTGLSSFSTLEVATAAVLDEGLFATSTSPFKGSGSGNANAFFRPDTSGTYYVDVSDFGGTGAYTVSAAAVSTDYTNTTATTGVVTPACYCPGTLVLTDRGERPIEELAVGDRVITRSGASKPIKWIGRRSYFGRFLAANRQLLPIRIHAGALGRGLPRRDLLVSPCHALLIDGVLIPAGVLVNGVSITRHGPAPEISYLHLELASHDAIWAEGVLAETFIDDDSRGVFHNAHEYTAQFPAETSAKPLYCAPRLEHGFEVEAIRRRVNTRAIVTPTIVTPTIVTPAIVKDDASAGPGSRRSSRR